MLKTLPFTTKFQTNTAQQRSAIDMNTAETHKSKMADMNYQIRVLIRASSPFPVTTKLGINNEWEIVWVNSISFLRFFRFLTNQRAYIHTYRHTYIHKLYLSSDF